MCLMLYLATAAPITVGAAGSLTIESVPDDVLEKLRDKLSLPHVCLVLAGTCSCAFPQSGGEPMEYADWMAEWKTPEERRAEVENVRALLSLVRGSVAPGASAELLPVWNDDEGKPLAGRIETELGSMAPDRFLFAETWLYVVRA